MSKEALDIDKLAHELGPEGDGYCILRNVLPITKLVLLEGELRKETVSWWGQTDTTGYDDRTIKQRFGVFSHKLSRGPQDILRLLPTFHGLSSFMTDQVIEPLTPHYEQLATWVPDEITAQRYPMGNGELGLHFDFPRHQGLIGTFSVSGEATLSVLVDGALESSEVCPGDLFLQRMPGLFDQSRLPAGKGIRLKHAVSSPRGGEGRTSITIRANTIPGVPIPSFRYHNWQPEVENIAKT